jgi:putative transposase
MQLVSGRTAQSFNNRKRRDGAFWQDRYHATAVDNDDHLLRCMAYIDLNMVRANVVAHPADWDESGYREIQRLPKRYRIIDVAMLQRLFGCATPEAVRALVIARTGRVLAEEDARRDPAWTESLAVGSREFLVQIRQGLGLRAAGRAVVERDDLAALREESIPYRPI